MAENISEVLRIELIHEAENLLRLLLPPIFAVSERDPSSPEVSENYGYFVKLCSMPDKSHMQLWYDYSSGGQEPMFWVGLRMSSFSALNRAIDLAADDVKPRSRFDVNEGAVSEENLKHTVVEQYDDQKEYYLGRYFSDYSADAALDYLRALVGVEDSPRIALEGEVRQRMATFFERDLAARDRCLSRPNGDVCCVCDMRFADRYGIVGNGYIHVHHTVPLHTRKGRTPTTDEELVSVCPNCHAMLHRYKLRTPEELRSLMKTAPERTKR